MTELVQAMRLAQAGDAPGLLKLHTESKTLETIGKKYREFEERDHLRENAEDAA